MDERALLTCMMYVDLNPIRSNLCTTLEESNFTSIQKRLFEKAQTLIQSKFKITSEKNFRDKNKVNSISLVSFQNEKQNAAEPVIPFAFNDYLLLIEWTGRAVREDKKGSLSSNRPSVLEQLQLNPERFVDNIKHYQRRFKVGVGSFDNLKAFADALGKKWLTGLNECKQLFV